ncbi:hypothetical protein M427DRAFT_412060 [Gonapodya prolifera JEL478]|uniref:Uncharacterized protein n=1 Tax=Gonapodya prolifera (strain JEL478) TaxID=1344416 RepID=A0A139A6D5_GONPJ|nr:hypothetical protein M427DRAFT_412060 [Gonapodya prolifera JEL478]|eukprot:KXS12005.1 hypothetical protein M427DRAFT_412060 [Gonapodya prolifera JEL478]
MVLKLWRRLENWKARHLRFPRSHPQIMHSGPRTSLDDEEPTETEIEMALQNQYRFLVDADMDVDERGLDAFTMSRHRIAPNSSIEGTGGVSVHRDLQLTFRLRVPRSVVSNIPLTAAPLTANRNYYYFEVLISEIGGKTPDHILAAMDEYLMRTAIANSLSEGDVGDAEDATLAFPSPEGSSSLLTPPTLDRSLNAAADTMSIRSGRSAGSFATSVGADSGSAPSVSLSSRMGRRRKYDYDSFLEDFADSQDSDGGTWDHRRARSTVSESLSGSLPSHFRSRLKGMAPFLRQGANGTQALTTAAPAPLRRGASAAAALQTVFPTRATSETDIIAGSTGSTGSLAALSDVSEQDSPQIGNFISSNQTSLLSSAVSFPSVSSLPSVGSLSSIAEEETTPSSRARAIAPTLGGESSVDEATNHSSTTLMEPPHYGDHHAHSLVSVPLQFAERSTHSSSPLSGPDQPSTTVPSSSGSTPRRNGRRRRNGDEDENFGGEIPPFGLSALAFSGAAATTSRHRERKPPISVFIGLVSRP